MMLDEVAPRCCASGAAVLKRDVSAQKARMLQSEEQAVDQAIVVPKCFRTVALEAEFPQRHLKSVLCSQGLSIKPRFQYEG